jgi:hypothetical protein
MDKSIYKKAVLNRSLYKLSQTVNNSPRALSPVPSPKVKDSGEIKQFMKSMKE